MPPRPPDWLMYVGVVSLLLVAAVLGQVNVSPPSDTVPPAPTGRTLPPPSPFDPTVTVDVPPTSRPGTGTAFSISSGGVWLTARHVVEGCARTAVVVGEGRGVAAEVRIDPGGETALLITHGGAKALPLAPRQALSRGMLAYHPGFPGGRPGQVASRLWRRETLVLRGRRTRRESVLAWVQITGGDIAFRNLAGLSGGPAIDRGGRVVGVTIAQSRRRWRVYTTSPGALRAALARARVTLSADAEPAPMNAASFARISDDLRRDLRVVQVVCLGA